MSTNTAISIVPGSGDDAVNDEYLAFWGQCVTVGAGHLRWAGTNPRFANTAAVYAWQVENDALPEGMTVVPVCGVGWCCEPDHLGLVRIAAVA